MTEFSAQQRVFLLAPLAREHVKERQGLAYIEGWHAIDEANRIFGFDAWNRETLSMHLVSEAKDEQHRSRVAYLARVRVTVGDIVREGTGAGTGIDRDHGKAHESAAKEAETDAMKRALMTFGNPFGLALYDKDKRNVEDHSPGPIGVVRKSHEEIDAMEAGRHAATNGMGALKAWWIKLPEPVRIKLTDFKDKQLKPMAERADQQIDNNLAAG